MDWKEIGDNITEYAPKLGGLFGVPGAAIGGAVGVLGRLFGFGDKEPKPEELMNAIKTDPQAALKLRIAEMDFILQQREQDLREVQHYLQDVQSARSREVEVKKAGGSNTLMYVLAIAVSLGFFTLVFALIKIPLPEGSKEVAFILFGTLAAGFTTIMNYFFGSSKGSNEKNAMLRLK